MLGRVLGPATGSGNDMTQWVLRANGNAVPRRSLRPFTLAEKHSITEKRQRELFDSLVQKRHGTSATPPPDDTGKPSSEYDTYEDADEDFKAMPEIDDPVDANGRAIYQQPPYDQLLNTEVLMQQGDHMRRAKVTGRTLDENGRAIGTHNDNAYLNTSIYDVEFPNGEVKAYAANIIAENMLNQCDDDGFTLQTLDKLIDHRSNDDALNEENAYATLRNGQKRLRKTTTGWDILCKWTDGSTQWLPLTDPKGGYTTFRSLSTPKRVDSSINLHLSGGFRIPFDNVTLLSPLSKHEYAE